MMAPSISQQLQESLGNMKLGDDSCKDGTMFGSPWMDDLESTYQPPHPLDQSSSSDKFGLNRYKYIITWILCVKILICLVCV